MNCTWFCKDCESAYIALDMDYQDDEANICKRCGSENTYPKGSYLKHKPIVGLDICKCGKPWKDVPKEFHEINIDKYYWRRGREYRTTYLCDCGYERVVDWHDAPSRSHIKEFCEE